METQYRILAVSLHTPEPDKAAGDRRFVTMLEMMAKRFKVDLWIIFPTPNHFYPTDRKLFEDIGVDLIEYDSQGKNSLPVVLARADYDLAIFEFFKTFLSEADSIRRIQPATKLVIDTVDIAFARESMAVALGIGSADAVAEGKRAELAAYRAADGIILVTDLDAGTLDDEGGMPAATTIIPIILPLRPRPEAERGREVLFVGGFNHPPNEDGVRWLVDEAWPIVRQAVPDARLTIVGSNATEGVKALDSRAAGVEVVGYVPDTGDYLDRAAISVAPLRFGAGMKGKVCEAMASGLPVVTTACGAQGLTDVSKDELLIEDSADGFAQAIIDLLRHPERADAIGRAGQTYIASICGPEAIEANLLSFLSSFLPPQPKTTSALKLKLRYIKARVVAFLRWQKYSLSLRLGRASEARTADPGI